MAAERGPHLGAPVVQGAAQVGEQVGEQVAEQVAAHAAADAAAPVDRVGIAWRDELAADLYRHLDRFDHVELIAERELRANSRRLDALRELARQVSVSVHGVALGPASTTRIECARHSHLSRLARLIHRIEPEHWSEHLAFVRSGSEEIGHLAQAPRNEATVEGTQRNLALMREAVGAPPHLENIATLMEPPGSTMDEASLVGASTVGTDLLLDLHNLFANAINRGEDPATLMDAFPLDRVKTVHVSGGVVRRTARGRSILVDDHLHDPPAQVYRLLERLAARVTHPLTVILERDGDYPETGALLDQLAAIRAALTRGRALCEAPLWPVAA